VKASLPVRGGFMNNNDFPALFKCADESSNDYQKLFLRLIIAEYITLLIAAVLSMELFKGAAFFVIYAFIFVVGLGVLLMRALRKPEQDWYRCRALAESVKTLSWRYMMHAAPFQASELGEQMPRNEFRNQLHSIFDTNRSTAEKIKSDWSANDQITTKMAEVRALPLNERMNFYVKYRIDDQGVWYSKKAKANRNAAICWVWVAVVAYLLAIALALSRIAYPTWEHWPIEPVIVFAASIIGWIQIKKFNELTAAYTVATHEIGMIKPLRENVTTEVEFSEFINDAEMAFSREHTLWIARQSN
jgi:hypothetical protein